MTALLQINDLRVTFGRPRRPWRPRGRQVEAVAGVDLAVGQRETLALVGESGSGKTTVARCVVGLAQPTGGAITFDGTPLAMRRRPGGAPVDPDGLPGSRARR